MRKASLSLLVVISVVVLVALALPQAWAQTPSDNGVIAAVVNGQQITREVLVQRLLSFFGASMLDSMVTDTLLEQEAKRRGVTITEQEVDAALEALKKQVGATTPESLETFLNAQGGISLALFRHQARRFALLEKVFADQVQVTDKEVEELYTAHKEEYLRPEMIQVRLISQPTEAQAKAVLERLRKGEDFQSVAKDVTSDPARKAAAGVIWRYFRGQTQASLPASIENALFAAPVGSIQGPFEAEGEFHVFKLEQKLEKHQATLDEVKDTLREALRGQRVLKLRTETWPKWIEEEMKKATIERKMSF